jgi:hypothetical protein
MSQTFGLRGEQAGFALRQLPKTLKKSAFATSETTFPGGKNDFPRLGGRGASYQNIAKTQRFCANIQ